SAADVAQVVSAEIERVFAGERADRLLIVSGVSRRARGTDTLRLIARRAGVPDQPPRAPRWLERSPVIASVIEAAEEDDVVVGRGARHARARRNVGAVHQLHEARSGIRRHTGVT